MTSRPIRKLTVQKETLRLLEVRALVAVVGGGGPERTLTCRTATC